MDTNTLNPAAQLYRTTHPAMGTEYSLYLYAPSREQAAAIARPVFEEVDRVDGLLSNYRPGSELSRINREAFQHDVTTDPETFRFLETCMAWSERSRGAFDISVGKLMKAWKFFGASGAVPSQEQLAAARADVGWEKIRLDRGQRTVRFLAAGIELGPGGVGKGYAVDRAVRILRARQVPAALLSAGSSTIYALGAPPGEAASGPAPSRPAAKPPAPSRPAAEGPAAGGSMVVERLTSSPRYDSRILEISRDDDLRFLSSRAMVGVGLGVSGDDYSHLSGLCDVLDAALVATRKVTDRGWLPRARQVGLTGHVISPVLYVAVGISGRFNHMVGTRAARCVVAINSDADAPVFSLADVGLVGEWQDLVPALTAELRRYLGVARQR